MAAFTRAFFLCLATVLLAGFAWLAWKRVSGTFSGAMPPSMLVLPGVAALLALGIAFCGARARLLATLAAGAAGLALACAEVLILSFWTGNSHLNGKRGAWRAAAQFAAEGAAREARKTNAPGREEYPPLGIGLGDPTAGPPFFRVGTRLFHPIGGISGAVTVMKPEANGWQTYVADEHGFHNPRGTHAGRADLALLGDSFVEGYSVPEDQDIASQIRAMQRGGVRVVNLGRANRGPLSALATLEEYGRPLEPKYVVWVYYEGNDLEDLALELVTPVLRDYLKPGFRQGLRDLQPHVDAAWRAKWRESHPDVAGAAKESKPAPSIETWRARWIRYRESFAFSALKLTGVRTLLGLVSQVPAGATVSPGLRYDPAFEAIVARMRSTTESWGGRLSVVYLPMFCRFAKEQVCHHYFRDQALRAFAQQSIPVIDLLEEWSQDADPMRFIPNRAWGHLTVEGYGEVARRILKALPEND